jgi:hypothetical protein
MSQASKFSKETHSKLIHFLEGEFAKLKAEHQELLKKRIMKRKNIDKKRQKLYQKVESILNISPLDSETKEILLSLQQEIKDFS